MGTSIQLNCVCVCGCDENAALMDVMVTSNKGYMMLLFVAVDAIQASLVALVQRLSTVALRSQSKV